MTDPQTLLEEKVSTEEKLALTQYDLRLAQEDLSRLKSELQKQKELSPEELNGLFFVIDRTSMMYACLVLITSYYSSDFVLIIYLFYMSKFP